MCFVRRTVAAFILIVSPLPKSFHHSGLPSKLCSYCWIASIRFRKNIAKLHAAVGGTFNSYDGYCLSTVNVDLKWKNDKATRKMATRFTKTYRFLKHTLEQDVNKVWVAKRRALTAIWLVGLTTFLDINEEEKYKTAIADSGGSSFPTKWLWVTGRA